VFKCNTSKVRKGKHLLLTRQLNTGQNHDVRLGHRGFENVYSSYIFGNYNDSVQEEIKRILDSGNACYYSVQKFLFSRLPSKLVKIRINKTTVLPVVFLCCET
jgi:hypothetical protein